jgi:hypothetical protein
MIFSFPRLHAGTPESRCFDAATNKAFSTAQVIANYSELGSKMPKITYNSKGNPTELAWMSLPEKASADVEEIGSYMGRSIYRVRYKNPIDKSSPDDQPAEVICTMLALELPQTANAGSPPLSPFFVDADEDPPGIRHYDTLFTSSKDQPFALYINKSMKGTGLYTYTWTFLFLSDGAHLAERSTFGRKEGTKTFHYDKSGKTVSTQTSENK